MIYWKRELKHYYLNLRKKINTNLNLIKLVIINASEEVDL
jgi:hypothetical protein